VTAARLLKDPVVAAAIADGHARRAKKLEISAERVLEELMKLAIYDPGDLYYEDGSRIPVHLLDDVTRAAVFQVEDETQETLGEEREDGTAPLVITRKQKIRMAEKGQNLERLGKYLKLFQGDAFSATMQPGANAGDAPQLTVTFVKAG
jgi:phage terminase small subunit